MRLKNLDLIVGVAIAVLNVANALLPIDSPVLRVVLALPLIFVLPGYTLSEALFHKRSLNASERFLFSLGLSLAIDILGGLFLNILWVGLQETSWVALLGVLTLIFSLLAANLRRRTPMGRVRQLSVHLATYPGTLFGLAIAVAIVSIVYAVFGAAHQPYTGFTQLWILPEVSNGKNCAVRLGIKSFESSSVTYRLTVTGNEASVATWPSVSLASQEEWVRLVSITPGTAKNIVVEAHLYRLNKPEVVYRDVRLLLENCPTSQSTPTSYPSMASAYYGTIANISANITTTLSFTRVQQSGENITGYLTTGNGLQGSGSFQGRITAAEHIYFTVTNATKHAILSFDGAIQSDGTLAGSYCSLNPEGQCSGSNYGLWSVVPTST